MAKSLLRMVGPVEVGDRRAVLSYEAMHGRSRPMPATTAPMGQTALLDLVTLKLTTLNVASELDVLTSNRKIAEGGAAGVCGWKKKADMMPTPPA